MDYLKQFLKYNNKYLYWLLIPVLSVSLQLGPYLFSSHNKQVLVSAKQAVTSVPLTPAVLGASTVSIRGSEELPQESGVHPKTVDFGPKDISAKSFLAYDLDSGKTIAEKKPDAKLAIASLTKLLTGLVVYDRAGLNGELQVPESELVNDAPVLKLAPGDKVKVSDLFDAMIIGSTNDAAEVLADYTEKLTGKKFTLLMNEKAQELGMTDSHFSNPLGFDSSYHYSTANDLKKLVDTTQKLAAFTNLGKKTSFKFKSSSGNAYHTVATNKLVATHPEIEAVKTGYTENSQGSMITKLVIDDHKIILIVLGSNNREKDTLTLAEKIKESLE